MGFAILNLNWLSLRSKLLVNGFKTSISLSERADTVSMLVCNVLSAEVLAFASAITN